MTLSRVIRTNVPGVRAKRIPIGGGLAVESKTLGTMLSYDMATANVSRTGMLLTLGRSKRVPFQINTLIEMTVDADGQLFERPVNCLGKVVRLEKTEAENQGEVTSYGVHIIEIHGRDLDVWEKGVVQLEAIALDKPMEQLPAA